jgi:hypothetical protein
MIQFWVFIIKFITTLFFWLCVPFLVGWFIYFVFKLLYHLWKKVVFLIRRCLVFIFKSIPLFLIVFLWRFLVFIFKVLKSFVVFLWGFSFRGFVYDIYYNIRCNIYDYPLYIYLFTKSLLLYIIFSYPFDFYDSVSYSAKKSFYDSVSFLKFIFPYVFFIINPYRYLKFIFILFVMIPLRILKRFCFWFVERFVEGWAWFLTMHDRWHNQSIYFYIKYVFGFLFYYLYLYLWIYFCFYLLFLVVSFFFMIIDCIFLDFLLTVLLDIFGVQNYFGFVFRFINDLKFLFLEVPFYSLTDEFYFLFKRMLAYDFFSVLQKYIIKIWNWYFKWVYWLATEVRWTGLVWEIYYNRVYRVVYYYVVLVFNVVFHYMWYSVKFFFLCLNWRFLLFIGVSSRFFFLVWFPKYVVKGFFVNSYHESLLTWFSFRLKFSIFFRFLKSIFIYLVCFFDFLIYIFFFFLALFLCGFFRFFIFLFSKFIGFYLVRVFFYFLLGFFLGLFLFFLFIFFLNWLFLF